MELLPVPILHPAYDAIGRLKSLVLDSVTSRESKRAYDRAITDFLNWGSTDPRATGFTKATVQAYNVHLHTLSLASPPS